MATAPRVLGLWVWGAIPGLYQVSVLWYFANLSSSFHKWPEYSLKCASENIVDCSTNIGNSLWSYCSQTGPGLYQLCFHYQVQQDCMDRKAGCHGMCSFWGEFFFATWAVKGKSVLLAAKSRVPFSPLQISLRAWEFLLYIATEFHVFFLTIRRKSLFP